MTREDIIEIVQMGETSKVQFKEILTSGLSAELVAMANSVGGTIIIGVKDQTGEIIGLSDAQLHDYSSKVANIATSNVFPIIYITTDIVKIEDKKLLVIYLDEGINKPYKDNQGSIWVKQGPDKRRVFDNNEILRLFQKSANLYVDEMEIYDSTISDIDRIKFQKFYEKEFEEELTTENSEYSKILHNINVLRNNKATLGGLLFFGKEPQKFKTAFMVKAVSFFGNDIEGVHYRDSKDIKGTIPEMFDATVTFVMNNIKFIQKNQDFNSVGSPEISKITIEELVQNAFVHRDYTKNSPIRILIFDNRIEIISPGRLPNSLTIENIKAGNAVIRNNILATFCSKTMKYRGLGSGIRRAIKETKNILLLNDIEGEQFIVTIPRS